MEYILTTAAFIAAVITVWAIAYHNLEHTLED